MYSQYSNKREYDAYVNRLAKDYRASQAVQDQVVRFANRVYKGVAEMLNSVSNSLSANSSNGTMQPDPS